MAKSYYSGVKQQTMKKKGFMHFLSTKIDYTAS